MKQPKLVRQIIKSLNGFANPNRAKWNNSAKPVQSGGYAAGDIFIGVPVPDMRGVAKEYYQQVSLTDLDWLFASKIHEHRFVGTEVLNFMYEKDKGVLTGKHVIDYLLKQLKAGAINNWDLVDNTAYTILGKWLHEQQQTKLLERLAKSKNLWEQRTAMVATYAFIRQGKLEPTYKIARLLMKHEHDLIHKAVGWMLREAGIKDSQRLLKFIKKYYNDIPRTTLRYAIERFPKEQRVKLLDFRT